MAVTGLNNEYLARAVNCSDPKNHRNLDFPDLKVFYTEDRPKFLSNIFLLRTAWLLSCFCLLRCLSIQVFYGNIFVVFAFSEHKIQRLLNCSQCFLTLLLCNYVNLSQCGHSLPIPVVMLFNAYVNGGSIAGSAISNLADSMNVRFLRLLPGGFGSAPVTCWSLVKKCPIACACLIVCDLEVSTMGLPRLSWTVAPHKKTK